MAAKKRKPTTDATKAKLPKPKRKAKPDMVAKMEGEIRSTLRATRANQKARVALLVAAATSEKAKAFENAPSPEAEAFARPMNVPVDRLDHPLMKQLRAEFTDTMYFTDSPRAIPCGEDLLPDVPWTYERITLTGYTGLPVEEAIRVPPPDTSAYPWPLKFVWWLDGWLARIAKRFA